MLQHASQLQAPMQEAVIDERFRRCSAFDATIRNTVLSDEFWGHVTDAMEIMGPVYFFIRDVDSNSFHIGEAYERICAIGASLSECKSTDKAAAKCACFSNACLELHAKLAFIA